MSTPHLTWKHTQQWSSNEECKHDGFHLNTADKRKAHRIADVVASTK